MGTDVDSPELNLKTLIALIGDDLPSVVFSDDPVTKMHDSLPMVLFRFEILYKLYQAREFSWFAYFFPWVLMNEAMSNKAAGVEERLFWLRIAYCYLMKCMQTYQKTKFGPGLSPFGTKKNGDTRRRILFDRKLLMHSTNSIAGIVYEVRTGKGNISLQRISTVPVEKKFGVTRMHAGRHQTLSAIIKTMQMDEAMKFVYANVQVKNRRLAYGETVRASLDLRTSIGDWDEPPILFAEAILALVGFPAELPFTVTQTDLDPAGDALHQPAEQLMSDELLPFAKTKISMMTCRRRRSLYQELLGVAPSGRRILISSKSELAGVVDGRRQNPIERELSRLLGLHHRILVPELRIVIMEVCQTVRIDFAQSEPGNQKGHARLDR